MIIYKKGNLARLSLKKIVITKSTSFDRGCFLFLQGGGFSFLLPFLYIRCMSKALYFFSGLFFIVIGIVNIRSDIFFSVLTISMGLFGIWYAYTSRKELDEADYQNYIDEKKQKKENYNRRKERISQIWGAFKNPAKKK